MIFIPSIVNECGQSDCSMSFFPLLLCLAVVGMSCIAVILFFFSVQKNEGMNAQLWGRVRTGGGVVGVVWGLLFASGAILSNLSSLVASLLMAAILFCYGSLLGLWIIFPFALAVKTAKQSGRSSIEKGSLIGGAFGLSYSLCWLVAIYVILLVREWMHNNPSIVVPAGRSDFFTLVPILKPAIPLNPFTSYLVITLTNVAVFTLTGGLVAGLISAIRRNGWNRG